MPVARTDQRFFTTGWVMGADLSLLSDVILDRIDTEVLGRSPLIAPVDRDDVDMMIETLIRRAARMVEFGVSATEITETFIAEGVSPEIAFLAVTAGRIAAQEPPDYTMSEGD